LSTPVDPFHERVARIALRAAGRYGFVLGGGLALILHGVVNRPTEDIDLFGPDTTSVVEAATAVRVALQEAGIRVVEEVADSDLAAVIDGMDYFMAEMIAYPDDRDDGAVRVSLGHLGCTSSPVVLDVGPVMAMQDLMAWKVAALVNRAEERDFVDVAVFLADHDIDTLLAMARAVDPAMDDEDVARAGRRLDITPDRAFAGYGLGADEISKLRNRFIDWPR
jgi:Nucleotidyl transferase AbiEii toxin, Type IV TA system